MVYPVTSKQLLILSRAAGTSGGVAAGRLAAADPSLKILLIESGPHVQEDDNFVQPAKCLSHLRPDNPVWKVHVSNVSEYLGGRPQIVTCPHVVGGGSSVNCKSWCCSYLLLRTKLSNLSTKS